MKYTLLKFGLWRHFWQASRSLEGKTISLFFKGELHTPSDPSILWAHWILLNVVERTKKTAWKNIDFWRSYGRSKLAIFLGSRQFILVTKSFPTLYDVTGALLQILVHFYGHTTHQKQCADPLDHPIMPYSYTYSYTKMNAEFKKLCLIVWNLTVLPVWRHEMGI